MCIRDRDDSKPKKPSPPLIVKSAFSTGEWTVTLPWKPSETDARAMRLVVDARASASASLDVNAGYAVKGWGGAVTLDRLSLDVWENLPDLSQRTHSLAEAKGVSLSATSDQSDWSTGVSLDLVVHDVSAAVSTRRLQLIKELQGLFDDGAAPPHARSHGGSSAQKEAKTSVPLAFPPISMSVQLDTVGTLIVNDGEEDETIGVPLVEAAVLGLSASLTADADTRSGLRVSVNVEAQALVDFLNHRKGAWEPIVEPWRVRVGVDALIAPEKTRLRPKLVSRSSASISSSSQPPKPALSRPRLPRWRFSTASRHPARRQTPTAKTFRPRLRSSYRSRPGGSTTRTGSTTRPLRRLSTGSKATKRWPTATPIGVGPSPGARGRSCVSRT